MQGANCSRSTLSRPSVKPCQWASAPSPRQDTIPIPVIQTSRGTSSMSDRLDRKLEGLRHLLHAGAKFGVGEFNQPECDLGVADHLTIAAGVSHGHGEAGALVHKLARQRELLTGGNEGSQLGFFDSCEKWHARELGDRDEQPTRGLRHGFNEENARHQRMAGKVSLKDRGCGRYARLGADRLIGDTERDYSVDQLKIFEPHASALGALGSDKLVDAGAKIIQLKVLIRRRFAVVDFLGPLLERHFDAERLVDRKRDIEKIQAVDAEVVDGVTLRLDRLARNVARLGDDASYRIEGRRGRRGRSHRRDRLSRVSHAYCTGCSVLAIAGRSGERPISPAKKSAAGIAKTSAKFNAAAASAGVRK